MPSITLNKEVFEKLVGKKLPLETLKDRISYLGTDLERIEGNEINVEVFPNRPDMLSEQGFARAFSSFIGVKTGLREYNVKKSGHKLIIDKSVNKVRPYTACAIVKNLKFDDEKIREVIQIQEKLHITYGRHRKKAAIGIYPYEKITPPIKFIAKNPKDIVFLPLEGKREMNGLQILGQHPAGREYGHLLEGLNQFSVFIDSTGKILSMPPIINSHETGKITESTKDVFVECSGFDFGVLSKCLNIIVTALADMGGEIYSMELEFSEGKKTTPELKPEVMKVDSGYVNKLLGLQLKESEMTALLEKMGFGYKNGNVLIPAYRADILHPIDLVEDIAIAYGYENFESSIPNVATIAEEDKFEIFKRKVAQILLGLGLIEVNTYHLIDKEIQTNMMNCDIGVLEVSNSVSVEYNSLRAWILPSLMNVLKENKHNEFPQKIFDMGVVFKKNGKAETGIEEATRLCVMSAHGGADFTEIKQILEYLLDNLSLQYEIEEVKHGSFIAGRTGRVLVKGKKVAYIGEVHPLVLEAFGLEMPVVGFELNLTEIFNCI